MSVPIVSYAQNFEDVMLWRAVGDCESGVYVDVGAQDPVVDSISHLFRDQGWRGVHVEPNATYASALRESCPGDLVIEAAVGARRDFLPFFQFDETGLSTLDSDIARQHQERGFKARELRTTVITLDDVLAASPGGEIQWLKIDVEGLETQVLKGWREHPARPWVVVVESTRPLSQVPSFDVWEPLLVRKGYEFAYADGLNRFYLSNAHADRKNRFAAPPNVFDGFRISGLASAPYHLAIAERHQAELHTLEASQESARTQAAQSLETLQLELRLAQEALKTSSAHQNQFHLEIERSWEEARSRHSEALAAQEARIERLQEDLVWQRADAVVRARDYAERLSEALLVAKTQRQAHQAEVEALAQRADREREEAHRLLAQQLVDAREQARALEELGAARESEWACRLKASEDRAAKEQENHWRSRLETAERLAAEQHQEALLRETRLQCELDASRAQADGERMVLQQQLADAREQAREQRERTSTLEAQWANLLDASQRRSARQLEEALRRETWLKVELDAVRACAGAEQTKLLQGLAQKQAEQNLQSQATLSSLRQAFESSRREAALAGEQAQADLQKHQRLLSDALTEARTAHQQEQTRLEGEVHRLGNALEEQRQTTDAEAALLRQESSHLKAHLTGLEQAGLVGWLVRRLKPYSDLRDELKPAPRASAAYELPDVNHRPVVEHQAPPTVSTTAMLETATSASPGPSSRGASHISTVPASVDQLIALDDEDFVHASYLSILLRDPDPMGYADYVRQVRAGVSKERIVVAMASSPEGSAARSSLEGLAGFVSQHALKPAGWRTRLARRTRYAVDEQVEQRQRALDNKMARLLAAQSQNTPMIESVNSLRAQFEQSTTALGELIAAANDPSHAAAMQRQTNDKLDALAALGQHTLAMAEALSARNEQQQAQLDMLVQLCRPSSPQIDPREVALDALQGQLGAGARQALARLREASDIAVAREQR